MKAATLEKPPAAPPGSAIETANFVLPAELVAPMGERMPPVTESSPTAPPPDLATPPPPPTPGEGSKTRLYDSRGVKFSPLRHCVNPDGSPLINKKGNFRVREDYRQAHGGRPEQHGGAPTFNTPPGAGPLATDPNAPPLQDEFDAAAEIYLQSAYGPVIIAFSENARPDREDHAALKVAVANYLRVKNIKEPSPGWALMFVITAVTVKKSADPVVRERAVELGSKLGFVKAKQPESVK